MASAKKASAVASAKKAAAAPKAKPSAKAIAMYDLIRGCKQEEWDEEARTKC